MPYFLFNHIYIYETTNLLHDVEYKNENNDIITTKTNIKMYFIIN